jgi:hypothetical protein
MTTETTYNRTALVTALISAVEGARLGTAEIRSLIDSRDKDMSLVAVELTSVFHELGYSDEHKEFFNGSFRSMLRNALRQYGSYGVKVSYKRTREYSDGDRELAADNSGSWFWHVQLDIQLQAKSDEDMQAIADSNEVIGDPVELSETAIVINKVLDSEKIDRVEAALTLLQSLSGPAAAHVVSKYLESKGVTSMREIRKAAAVEMPHAEPVQAAAS